MRITALVVLVGLLVVAPAWAQAPAQVNVTVKREPGINWNVISRPSQPAPVFNSNGQISDALNQYAQRRQQQEMHDEEMRVARERIQMERERTRAMTTQPVQRPAVPVAPSQVAYLDGSWQQVYETQVNGVAYRVMWDTKSSRAAGGVRLFRWAITPMAAPVSSDAVFTALADCPAGTIEAEWPGTAEEGADGSGAALLRLTACAAPLQPVASAAKK